jgi:hypothetical protein
VEEREAVGALGGGGEGEELERLDVVEEVLVGARRGVVELVDDDDVEVVGREVGEAGGVEALDGGEDVVEAGGPAAADPELAEGVVAQGVAEVASDWRRISSRWATKRRRARGRKARRRA